MRVATENMPDAECMAACTACGLERDPAPARAPMRSATDCQSAPFPGSGQDAGGRGHAQHDHAPSPSPRGRA